MRILKEFVKGLVLLASSYWFIGCAHQTAHEYCSDPANVIHYKNYDQCYYEVKAEKARQGSALQAFGQGFSQGYNQNRTVNCTTWGNQTTCH